MTKLRNAFQIPCLRPGCSKFGLALSFLGIMIYIVLFALLYPRLGPMMGPLVSLPITIIALNSGFRGGLTAGLLSLPFTFLLAQIWPHPDKTMFHIHGIVFGFGLAVLLGAGVGWARDLYRRTKLLEYAFRQENMEWHTIFDSIEDMVSIHSLDHRILRVNRAFLRQFGLLPGDLLGRTCSQFFHWSTNPHPLCPHLETIQKKMPVRREFYEPALGKWLEVATSPLFNAEDQCVGTVHFVKDISKRKKAEELIRDNEEQLRLVTNSIPALMAYLDEGLILKFHNRLFETWSGFSPDQIMGKHLSEVTDPAVYKQVESKLNAVLSGNSEEFEIEVKLADGALHTVRANLVPHYDASGRIRGLFVMAADITRQKKNEVELRKANRELEQAIRKAQDMALAAEAANRSKSAFLANMSHEIRTPMNSIIGLTELVLETELNEKQREYLEMVTTSATHLLTIINDILDLSKVEAGRMRLDRIAFDIRYLVESVLDMFAVRAQRKGIDLHCTIAPDVPSSLVGDPGKLRQIITNLVGNAVKFTNKGDILIRIESSPAKSPQEINVVQIHIMVCDTGIGIPQESLSELFNKFFQVDASSTKKYGGTGLGLAICKEYARLMGGEIRVESPVPPGVFQAHGKDPENAGLPGPGCAFHVVIPFQATPAKDMLADNALFLGTSVLVVDDNPNNRTIIREMLLNWGFSPECAANGREALDKLSQALRENRPYRIAILDSFMPEMDGFELAHQIRAQKEYDSLQLMMLTSTSGFRGDAEQCKQLRITSYLTRPVKQSHLFDALRNLLSPNPSDVLVTKHTLDEHKPPIRVLLAEDNSINQKLATALLGKIGCTVETADTGREAVEKLKERDYDVVFMDIHMPEMDGLAATAAIRNPETGVRNSRVPIVAMTAEAMHGDKERCLAAGMDDYLSKPIRRADLLRVLLAHCIKTEAAVFGSNSPPDSKRCGHE